LDFEIGVEGDFGGAVNGEIGIQEVDLCGVIEASAGGGDLIGLPRVVLGWIEGFDPEGSGGDGVGGSDAGDAGAVEGGEAGIQEDGSGVVAVGGASCDAEGVGALEAFGAVDVAAEDSGGAGGGGVSGLAGEEGGQEGEEAVGSHWPSPPAQG
jgi:hypothetical protein